MARRWNPFASSLVPLKPAARRRARLWLIYQVPFTAFFIWFIWTHIWAPGWPISALLLLTAMSALALFGTALNVRQAWFLAPDSSDD